MVRIRTDLPDTSSRREDAPQWRVPLGSYPDRQCRHPSSAGKARLAVHHRSACPGVKALRNTSDAKAASRQAMLAFRSLDPFRALREPDRRRRDEERLSRSEQRTLSKTQNNHLTGKAPYKSRANRDVDDLALISRGSQDRRGRDRRGGRASSVTTGPHTLLRNPEAYRQYAAQQTRHRVGAIGYALA